MEDISKLKYPKRKHPSPVGTQYKALKRLVSNYLAEDNEETPTMERLDQAEALNREIESYLHFDLERRQKEKRIEEIIQQKIKDGEVEGI